MTQPIPINTPASSDPGQVSHSPPVPKYSFAGSPPQQPSSTSPGRSASGPSVSPGSGRPLHPFPAVSAAPSQSPSLTVDSGRPSIFDPPASKPKILLLESIAQTAVKLLTDDGFEVHQEKGSLGEDDLIKRLSKGGAGNGDTYVGVGIRSKTKVTGRVIKEVKANRGELVTVGCFCIGTNQVDLVTCSRAGIPVFNSPFSNSRSVAELVISEVIALSRQLCDRVSEMRSGVWNKVSKGCWEIRGKTLGIVGYGHIGSQLSVLAEAMGLSVLYYDVLPLMPLGSAKQVNTLDELLSQSDFVTLHVPEQEETRNMIGKKELSKMKQGSYLLNNARGTVVVIEDLIAALESKRLAGAAIDVYPKEPPGNGTGFDDSLNIWASKLCSLPNVILTPHIGGSTEEAQRMIGNEVGSSVSRYINYGSSLGAVNFPEVFLKPIPETPPSAPTKAIRLCHVHLNQPGVLRTVNGILGEYNVDKQFTESKGEIAYLLADIEVAAGKRGEEEVKEIDQKVRALSSSLVTRVLL